MQRPTPLRGRIRELLLRALAAAITGFERIEWDEVKTAGIDASAYSLKDGVLRIPDVPGFGLNLDDNIF